MVEFKVLSFISVKGIKSLEGLGSGTAMEPGIIPDNMMSIMTVDLAMDFKVDIIPAPICSSGVFKVTRMILT